jgi:hypothetical protein
MESIRPSLSLSTASYRFFFVTAGTMYQEVLSWHIPYLAWHCHLSKEQKTKAM